LRLRALPRRPQRLATIEVVAEELRPSLRWRRRARPGRRGTNTSRQLDQRCDRTGRGWGSNGMPAFRSVMSVLVSFAW